MGGQRGDVDAFLKMPLPHPKRRHARAALVGRVLTAFQSGIEGSEFFAMNFARFHAHAVVRHEHDKRVPQHAVLIEVGEEETDIFVDVFDHSVTGGGLFIEPEIEKPLFGFLRRDHRRVGSVQSDVSEEWFFLRVLAIDPCRGRAEEQVRAEAFRANDGVVVQKHIVEVGSLGVLLEITVGELPDATGAVHENFVEPTILRQIRRVVAKVPLAEKARRVTGAPEGLGERNHSRREALALQDGMGDAHFKLVAPAQERGACGRASRANLEVGESRALGMKTVEVRRLQIRVPHAGQIPHALVVGENENNIRAAARERLGFSRGGLRSGWEKRLAKQKS